MLAVLGSALMQFAQTQTKSSECGSFEERLDRLTALLGKQPTATKIEGLSEHASFPAGVSMAPQKADGTASAILDLMKIEKELAHVEEMIVQVTNGAPDADDAKQYHEISLRALRCSRDTLSQKYAHCLAELRSSSPPPGLPAPEPPKVEKASWMGWSKEAVDACPEFVPENEKSGSLRHDLEMLREHSNPERVIIVRKIKQLGFESPTLLKEHFRQYGEVDEVLVAHSHVKSSPKRPNGRVRPAALGFVVMGSEEAAQSALQAGAEQQVGCTTIQLGPFEAFGVQDDKEK